MSKSLLPSTLYEGGIEREERIGPNRPPVYSTFVQHAEGRVACYGSDQQGYVQKWEYEYTLRDHLGNSRVMASDKNNDCPAGRGGFGKKKCVEQRQWSVQ